MSNLLRSTQGKSIGRAFGLAVAICLAWSAPLAQGQVLYSDNFSRATNPAPISPWLSPAAAPGAWEILNGTMQGGPNSSGTYGYVYVTNAFTNFSVQAQFRFSTTNAWGGGIGGYLNTSNGAHYAAWLYPDNSGGGGLAIRLVKFTNWTAFEYGGTNFAFMAVTNVASVGTNSHILRLAFPTNHTIQVFYDGNPVISTTDIEAQPYTNGAISMDMYTDANPYTMNAANLEAAVVSSVPLAVNDSYTGTSGTTLNVAAPGVLINDTDGQGPLTAVLGTTTTHGSLTLSNNGGFTYTPGNGFSGTDSFTYEANDGHTNSAPATVTLTITADVPPVANNDSYSLVGNTTLTVAPSGVLANDTDSDGQGLTAILVTSPTNGSLNLTNNGGFGYAPSNNFSGTDTFTYKANDGISNSTPATVTLTVLPNSTLFFDNFVRSTNPGPIAPWVAEVGNWTVTGGAMVSSLDTAGSYAFAYLTNVWTNYSVQGQVEYATNSFGGGIGGRLTSATGAHYAAWLYPENSPGGGPELRLVKFSNYSTFGYLGTNGGFMAVTNLAGLGGVGTGLHTLKLGFSGNQISVYLDGTQLLNVADLDAQTYPTGGVSADMYADTSADVFSLENVIVSPLANNDFYSVLGGSTLTVAAPGVLSNDTPVFTTTLTATQVTAPAHGSLTLSSNGGFVYTPAGGYTGQDSFTYQANDGSNNVGTATVYINVLYNSSSSLVFSENFDEVTAPALPTNWTTTATGVESNWVTTTVSNNTAPNSAFAPDVANIGLAELTSPGIALPAGPCQLTFKNNYNLEINSTNSNDGYDGGVLEIKIGTNAFTDIITAGGSFLAGGYNCVVDSAFGNPLAGRAAWSGRSSGFITTTVDLPPTASGQTVQLRWDLGCDNGNAFVGWWIDTISISNCPSASCWNTAPALPAQTNVTVNEQTLLTVTNTATSPGIATNTVTYSLLSAPTNAAISTNGIITWTPLQTQSPSTNTFTTRATNNGTPPLATTNTFTVFVKEVNIAPVLPAQTNVTNAGLATFTVTNTATEPNIHATTTGYNLTSSPSGMVISTNGIITWTPVASQVPSTNTVTTVATNRDSFDTVNPILTATNTFMVVTTTVHNGPSLPAQANRTNNELVLLTVTNTATDMDVPVLALTYVLTNTSPTNAVISTNGVITWTPLQTQSHSTNTFTTVVTDSGSPAKSATNNFTVVVKEVNVAPTLPTNATQTVNELTLLTVTNTATESNIDSVTTTYTLSNALAGMSISTNGIFTWTPTQTQSHSTNTVTTIVANTNAFDAVNPVLLSTNSFSVVVKEVNVAPTLPVIATQTINEQTLLTVTNAATETNIHSVTTGYTLVGALAGMNITTNGIFSWTPNQGQSHSTNTVMTIVANTNAFDTVNPVLLSTNSFTVVVKEVNVAPTLPVISTQTINEQTLLTVTNTATEANTNSVTTSYTLSNPLTGMSISSNGIFTWTPSPSQSHSTNTVMTIVANSNAFDTVNPVLMSTNSFTVVVKEVNVAPTLPFITAQTVNEQTLLTVTNTASEANGNSTITGYTLLGALAGMNIDTNGIFTWTPAQNQSPGTNTVTTVVANTNAFDTVNPVLKTTNMFTVIVKEINIAPTLPVVATQTVNEQTLLTVTNTATEPNIHAVTTGYALSNALAGMSISTNGIFTWTPSQTQSPGTNTVTVVVTNNDSFDTVNPMLTATNTFTVIVQEVNIAPILPVIGTQTTTAQNLLTVADTATEPNIHAVTTGYALINPISGMSIDTNGNFTWTPTSGQSPSTNTVTVVATNNDSFDLVNPQLTATNSFTVVVRDVNIAPVLPFIATQTVNEQTLLTVTNTATESNPRAVITGYGLMSPLAGMSIDTNGIFTWTPAQTQSPGTNMVIVVVTNNDSADTVNPVLTTTNTFSVIVKEINIAPILPVIATQTINEQTLLILTNTATEPNIHATTTGYGLVNPLAGMGISTNGIFAWMPAQTQSPGTNTVTVVVTNNDSFDAVNPTLTATNTFTVIVKEMNIPPTLPVIGTQTVNEQTLLTVTNTATESNIHAVTTGYGLNNPLLGMSIDTNGIFTWTPSQSQSPGTNTVTVVVTNNDTLDTVNPTLVATNTFTVIVREINIAPTLPVIGAQTVNEQTLLTVTNTATEANIHATTTGYGLISPLTGMSISAGGIFTWTPSQNQSPGTNTVMVVVTNNDSFDAVNPILMATNSFTVIVKEINIAPVLPVIGTQTVSEQTLLTVTNTATEPNIHAVTTGYALINPVSGMNLDTNGIFTWTPSQAQSPGTNAVTVVVTNNDSFDTVNPTLTATNTFTVVVKEVNVAPTLPVIGAQTVNEQTLLTVTNTATESNVHATTTGYGLVGALTGMSISTNGIFTWTPSQNQSHSTNTVTVVVTNNDSFDTVNPTLTATNIFSVVVKEINIAPTLPVIATQTVNEQTLLTVTNTATESNIHAVTTGYGLLSPLAGMSISTNGIFTWTPSQSQSPGTNTVMVVATNNDSFDSVNPILTTTNSFTVIVKEINVAPTLPVIGAQTVNEQTLLTVTNTATEANIHATTTGYGLLSPQAGMSISTNGIFTWTPGQTQSPGTNTVTVVVTNNDSFDAVNPTLTATNSFTVVVREVNIAPVLPVIGTQTIVAQTQLTVTNTATEPNIHASTVGYGLANPPSGASISQSGIITWTPQNPGTYALTTVVVNDDSYDTVNPILTSTNSFMVVVTPATNNPPPSGLSITVSNGIATITWNSVPGRLYRVQYKTSATATNWGHLFPDVMASGSVSSATDTATNSAQKFYRVVLLPSGTTNTVPVLPAQSNLTVAVGTQLTVTNTASDTNGPSDVLTYELVNAPAGAAINTNGIITWTPASVGTNTITTVVYDSGVPAMSATNSFQVAVNAPVSGPPPVIQSVVVSGGNIVLTWSAVSNDIYEVQYKTNITSTNWINIVPNVTASGSTASITNAIGSSPQQFYRIILLP